MASQDSEPAEGSPTASPPKKGGMRFLRFSMTETIYKSLMTIGGIGAALGSVWGLSEIEVLNIPPEVGAVTALISGVAIITANTIQAQWGTA